MNQTSTLSEQQLATRLNQAMHLLACQDARGAESVLAPLLAAFPSQPDALHLMGGVRSLQQRADEAEQFYRQSLAHDSNQPRVFVSLGLLLRRQGKLEEAIGVYREAIRLAPGYILGHFSLGVALHDMGSLKEAESAFRTVLRLDPTQVESSLALAAALNNQERYAEAEMALAAANWDSHDAALLARRDHYLGVARSGQHDHESALAHFDRALQTTSNPDEVEHAKANALRFLGREEEALDALRRALAHNPLNLRSHHELNQLLYRMKRDSEFLNSYDTAAAVDPNVAEIPLAKAKFLLSQQKNEDARLLLEQVARQFPYNLEALHGLALANQRLKDFGAAIAAYEKALSLVPSAVPLLTGLAAVHLIAGDARAAARTAERAWQLDAHNQIALATLSTAWRILGDEREYYLNGYDDLIRIYDIEPPEGYADISSFNRDLDAYLDRLHPEAREYIDQSLRYGTQTLGKLFGAGHDLVEKLRRSIEPALQRYIKDMRADDKHPLLSRRAGGFAFTDSWSSRLRDCGYHTNHIHPKGWISSVYYIALPESVAYAESKEGWLKFGEPSFDIPFADPIRRAVQPKSGQLVLFPSYMWHGTVPFRSVKSRTTIAFDAVPVKA